MYRSTVLALIALLALSTACRVEFNVGKRQAAVHGDPSFGSVVLSTRIDPVSKEPLDNVQMFDMQTQTINATINVKNVKAGATFRFQWKKGGQDAGAIVMTIPIDLIDNWVAGTIEPNGTIVPGDDWSIEVLFNGTMIATKTFEVAEAPPSTRGRDSRVAAPDVLTN